MTNSLANSTIASPTPKSLRFDAPATGNLTGSVKRIEELTAMERDQMYALMVAYFAGVSRAQFERDLAEKEWAIVMTDDLDRVQGFSTLMRLHTRVEGQPVVGFFSGDTIVHKDYWRETVLPRLWGRHVFDLATRVTDARVYWFLISSGYRTYRYLPTFFREFYPAHDRPVPQTAKRVLNALAQLKFGAQYDAQRGIVTLAEATPLHAGVSEPTEARLKDPHVSFFVTANPGHMQGDELACLAELTPENLTRAGRRMLEMPLAV